MIYIVNIIHIYEYKPYLHTCIYVYIYTFFHTYTIHMYTVGVKCPGNYPEREINIMSTSQDMPVQ